MNVPYEIPTDSEPTRPSTYTSASAEPAVAVDRLTAAPRAASSIGTVLAGLAVLAALGAGAWLTDRRLGAFLSALDEETLEHATRAFDRLLDRQRDQLASEVTVLADDNRIRATVLAPSFDQATVQDVIDDLRKVSGATLLAVLDGNGRVQAVSGTAALKEADLSASSSVKQAFAKPTSDVWTLPGEAQVIGLAPVRTGDQTLALLVKGLPLGKSQLASVESILDVAGAVFIGDKLVASSSRSPALEEALRAASHLSEGTERITTASGSYLVRVGRSGAAATAARVAWLVPHHHHLEHARALRLLVWCPVALGALLFVLLVANFRRTNGGHP
jgi:hypothetical protein